MSALRKRLARFVEWMQGAPDGRALAGQALLRPEDARKAWLSAQPAGTGFHVLVALLDHAYDRLDDAPRESIAVTELVLQLIHAEAGGSTRGEMREVVHGRAWHERGNALRQTGELLEALHAYEQASVIFTAQEIASIELAAAKRGEAFVRHQLGESEAALEMLRTATRVFRSHNDTAGEARCLLYEGAIHFENDRVESAFRCFRSALALARRLGDRKTVAFLHVNLANCAIERGDRESALRDFARALEYFERAGLLADRKRVAWGMAQLMIADGFIDRAIQALEDVANEMAASGLPIDAALARRDIVEVLVLAGRTDRAAEVARGVLDTLARAGMFRDAMRTLRLLQGADMQAASDRSRDHS